MLFFRDPVNNVSCKLAHVLSEETNLLESLFLSFSYNLSFFSHNSDP